MQVLRATFAWCVLFGLYLVLAGSTSATEIAAGAGATSLATLLIVLVHDKRRRSLILRPPPRVPVRTLIALATDTARVGVVLLRAILRRPQGAVGAVGAVVRQPFAGGDETARDAGRRGLVTLLASLAPNGFVLHVPGDDDALVLHRLARAPLSGDQAWPV